MSENFSTVEVTNALEPLSIEETRRVFFQLHVPLKILDDIAARYNGDMQKAYLVRAWLDMTPDASWDKLVTGLRKTSKNSLAAEIESEHLSKMAVATSDAPSLLSTLSVPVSAPPESSTSVEATTPAFVGPLNPATVTATTTPVSFATPAPTAVTPTPVGPLIPAPLTATPDPVDPLTPARLTATPVPGGPLSLVPTTATSAPARMSATPSPAGPLATHPIREFEQRVADAKDSVENLQEEFSDLKSEAREFLSEKEKHDEKFVRKFQDYLLDLPVTKKQVHIRFFSRNEDEILNAKTIQKLFAILGRYCNYSNYEIVFHIVKKFCPDLKGRMLKYRDSLILFEKSTTVDVYLHVISARPGGKIMEGFICMAAKISKPPSECTLYEIRKLKESIEENASLQSHAMYILTPEEGSVLVVLYIHEKVGWRVGVVFNTPDFREKHLVADVKIRNESYDEVLIKYLVRNYVASFSGSLANDHHCIIIIFLHFTP